MCIIFSLTIKCNLIIFYLYYGINTFLLTCFVEINDSMHITKLSCRMIVKFKIKQTQKIFDKIKIMTIRYFIVS
jgi:hypothetical protein